jgi:hypothetical protein
MCIYEGVCIPDRGLPPCVAIVRRSGGNPRPPLPLSLVSSRCLRARPGKAWSASAAVRFSRLWLERVSEGSIMRRCRGWWWGDGVVSLTVGSVGVSGRCGLWAMRAGVGRLCSSCVLDVEAGGP